MKKKQEVFNDFVPNFSFDGSSKRTDYTVEDIIKSQGDFENNLKSIKYVENIGEFMSNRCIR